jgi:hypothetical protein
LARFLTTIPVNLGYYNLGTVEAYPVGGTGPTAYGPTSYFGSDPLPARPGDSINNPVDLGDFNAIFRSITISNTHGGKTRIQSSFYKIRLTTPRALSVTQNYSPTSYQANTNRNTLIAVYKVEDGTHRRELPINDSGYVYKETGLAEGDSDYSTTGYQDDYPSDVLDPGTYIILITNDIRYLETTYSFTLNATLSDWRYVSEVANQSLDFGLDTSKPPDTFFDFGLVGVVPGTKVTYPYDSTSGLGYTRSGVSP